MNNINMFQQREEDIRAMKQKYNKKKGLSTSQTSQVLSPPRRTSLLFLLLAVLTATLAATGTARAMTLSPTPREKTWTTDGCVYSIARTTDTIYIGGHFSYVGPFTGTGVPLDTATGKPASAFSMVDGSIHACVSDGKSGWFIGGDFTHVGGVERNHLAHILQGGALDPVWNPDADGPVYALTVSGSMVYTAGGFTHIGGQPRQYLAALDTGTGTATDWNPGVFGYVKALAVSDSGRTVYAGGWFTRIGGQERNNIAALDAVTGAATSWNPNALLSNGTLDPCMVNALAISGAVIYVGGAFSQIGGRQRNSLAALDAATGTATAWNPDTTNGNPFANDTIWDLKLSGGVVYVAGDFSYINGQPRHNIAAIVASTGAVTAWDPDAGNTVSTLAVSEGKIYVGGSFWSIGGQERHYLAALDAVTGKATAWDPGANDGVSALAVSGGQIYAGGAFSSLGGQTRHNIAALDAATGIPTAWNPSADYNVDEDARVNALAISGRTVYAGGAFMAIGGQERHHLAALDAETGAATSWNPDTDDDVYALAVSDKTIYVGGMFGHVGGQPRSHIAAIDATTGVASTWHPRVDDGRVYALAVSDGVVYAGGSFISIDTQSRNGLAALDAATGQVNSWYPKPENAITQFYDIYALAVAKGTVYVGGAFTNIGGQQRSNIAALDAATGNATAWNPGANNEVDSLAIADEAVYAGGTFTSIGGQQRSSIAALDATTGNATDWNPGPERSDFYVPSVRALAASGGIVYVGGFFTNIGGQSHSNFAQFSSGPTLAFQTDDTAGATLTGTSPQVVESGENGTAVTANAPAKYRFVKWTKDGADYSTDNPLTVVNVTGEMTLVAHFEKLPNAAQDWLFYD